LAFGFTACRDVVGFLEPFALARAAFFGAWLAFDVLDDLPVFGLPAGLAPFFEELGDVPPCVLCGGIGSFTQKSSS
jgi:hypothetical protein